ncbi:MAG TPA: iron export ABC transporter permease subunit FetB [Symbiobacteriaceae bacterium]|nr:iron export ABC transporter permease subunit FetB [Symbiobacteriaceae bacterium]
MSTSTLLFTLLFVGIAGVVSVWQRLGLAKDLLVGTVRAGLQLFAIGYVLAWLLGANNLLAMLPVLAVMITVATFSAAKRAPGLPGIRWRVGVAIGVGALLTVGLMLLLQIIPIQVRFILPFVGMMTGAAMTTCSALLNRLEGEMSARRGEVELLLALGATPRQATAQVLRSAVRAAMIPHVDILKTVGLVQLPGTMTGQILAGQSPVEAVKYQILIMYALTSTAAVAAIILGLLAYRLYFNEAAQLVR